ncbi:LysR family transcriptional regulator [Zobellella maritima]|uniref:LysR family transcriptional regulator n=1 Tax=Zobellella maritima TaxID=2059725 RepID=UPI0018E526A2|nr:LysR family transcriptional regulator [Zobellella maritima]
MQMMVAIADAGSVAEAAQTLGLTQSALSHRIKEAERLLNTELFYRKHKKLAPTSAGKRLLYSSRLVLGEIERAEQDINKLSVGIEHVVRLGNESYGGYHWLPACLTAFNRDYPTISVEIIPDVSLDPYTALRSGRIDVALVSGGHTPEGFAHRLLFRDEMRLVMPEGHALAGKPWVEAAEVAAGTYVTYHTTPGKGREYEQLFSRYRMLPVRVLRAGVTEAVIALVREGFGLTIMPSWTLQPYLEQGGLTTARVTEQGLYIDWHLLTRKDEPADSPTGRFTDCLAGLYRQPGQP